MRWTHRDFLGFIMAGMAGMRSIVCMAMLALTLCARVAVAAVALQQAECSPGSKAFAAARAEAGRLLVAGRVAEAVAPLKRAYDLCSGDAENARDLASAAIEAGDTRYAEELLRDLIERQDGAELHSLLGKALARDGSHRDSAAQYQIAARMEPTEARIFDFGTSLMKVNFGAATEILRYGLKTYPASVRMHVALALALYAQDQSEEGARLLCAASALDPNDVHPMEVLADTKIVPKSVQAEAERRLDDLRRRHPGDGLLLFDYLMVKSGRWSGDKAANPSDLVPLLHKALALDPRLSKAHFELALVHDEEKNYSAEIAELQQAIRLTPSVEQFHYRLAFAYRAAGDMPHYKEELARYSSLHSRAEAVH